MCFNAWGILAFIIFSLCTFISVLLYPTPYSPLYDWISNLGNFHLNPSGAVFFNGGCIVTGLFMIFFFLNLNHWKSHLKYGNKLLLYLIIILGVFASISLIGVGVFSEIYIKIHVLSAYGVFGGIFILMILLNTILFNHPKFMHIVAYWGGVALFIDLFFILMLIIPQFHVSLENFNPIVPVPGLEWTAVYASLIWIVALSYNMYKNHV